MSNLPIYRRGDVWYLHTRVSGVQIKKSLKTDSKREAMLIASAYLLKVSQMRIPKFEVNLNTGQFKAEGPSDLKDMLDFMNSPAVQEYIRLANIERPQSARVAPKEDAAPPPALLHKSEDRRNAPSPRRSYAMAPTGTVLGRPSCVKRLSRATRTCNSTTCRSNVRAITRWPRRLKQCILVSTRLLR